MAEKNLDDLRSYLNLLEQEGELLIIDQEVNPYLEIAEIHRRVIQKQGPALLFTKVK
ncbi:MAG: UbiD family decarboxylase, partial [Proteobacteria bacterium]|nr:UbiD family decarboxylase [Pseudomonadota bacterium]